MTITILGSGTSTGVPMIGCDCRTCQSRDPRDQRLRTSALIEHRGLNVVIDTSADFRAQMLEARLTHLEAVLYTHQHYDHIAGFDDLRAFQFLRRVAPTCYANVATYDHIRKAFDYAFGHATQHGGGLPQVPFEVIDEAAFTIEGPRGARLEVLPIPLLHGHLPILGFRVGGFAYLTDCSAIPERSFGRLEGLDTLVLDGLRYKPHSTHLTIDEAVALAGRIGARQTYLTHMNHDILHAELEQRLPPSVRLAYDGLRFEIEYP